MQFTNSSQTRFWANSCIQTALLTASAGANLFQGHLEQQLATAQIGGTGLSNLDELTGTGKAFADKLTEFMGAIADEQGLIQNFPNYRDPAYKIDIHTIAALADKGMLNIHIDSMLPWFDEAGLTLGGYNSIGAQAKLAYDLNQTLLELLDLDGKDITAILLAQAKFVTTWNTLQAEVAAMRVLTLYAEERDMGRDLLGTGDEDLAGATLDTGIASLDTNKTHGAETAVPA